MHILIIDNDPLYSWIVKKFINRENSEIEVNTCTNAEIALDKISRQEIKPDLIILDLDMPVMDGFTFAQRYALTEVNHVPIVVLTNSLYKRDYERAKAIPLIKKYFVKPVDNDMIKEILSYALAEKN